MLRPLCEMNKFGCHAQSPLGVGACFPYSLSQTGAPLLPQHYPRSSLLWAPPTSHRHYFRPRCSGLSGSAYAMRRRWDLLGYRTFLLSDSKRPTIPGGRSFLTMTPAALLPAGVLKPSALPKRSFRDSTPSLSALSVTIAPRLLSYLRIKRTVTSSPTRLDTRPVASGYRGGIHSR